jgi:hypothetical protein
MPWGITVSPGVWGTGFLRTYAGRQKALKFSHHLVQLCLGGEIKFFFRNYYACCGITVLHSGLGEDLSWMWWHVDTSEENVFTCKLHRLWNMLYYINFIILLYNRCTLHINVMIWLPDIYICPCVLLTMLTKCIITPRVMAAWGLKRIVV